MSKTKRFLAFDLGAESGRAVLGTLEDERIQLREVHRFRTEGLTMLGVRQWDVARIYEEMVNGIARCAREHGPELDGMGVDTWGVDYALVDGENNFIGRPFAYRDARTEGVMERFFREVLSAEEVYSITGIQFLVFNTLFQPVSYTHLTLPTKRIV